MTGSTSAQCQESLNGTRDGTIFRSPFFCFLCNVCIYAPLFLVLKKNSFKQLLSLIKLLHETCTFKCMVITIVNI